MMFSFHRFPRQLLSVLLSSAVIAAIAACTQLQGLDDYENVECVGDCEQAPPITPTTDAAPADAAIPSACTPECTGATSCCSSACVPLDTEANCGACGNACAPTESCTARACTLRLVGDGLEGPLSAAADMNINALAAGLAGGKPGQKDVSVGDVTGFMPKMLVLIHQTRGANAGRYELATIANVDVGAKKLTMYRDLVREYTSTGESRAQVVRVHRYTTVTIAAGATVTAPAWDGTKGGILAFKATGAVSIAGAINMNGKGFRGTSHATKCTVDAMRHACAAANDVNGFAGESAAGPSVDLDTDGPNGSGGGGGQDGQDCGCGGGGGHGTVGVKGADGNGLVCRNTAQLGGAAALIAGGADLRESIFFGGAGGEGGGDEDGAYPGAGGNGGGIVWVDAQGVMVAGSISANGAAGAPGVPTDATCLGTGTGMGGGGGGAGGAVRIRVMAGATLGVGLVTAAGAAGGECGGDPTRVGGAGGNGRIGIAGTAMGATTPAPDPN